jgi:hypothetical protein
MFFNIKNSKIFFLSLFLVLWAAINSKAYDILYFYTDITNLTYFINFLRSIGPSIILFCLLTFILKNYFSKINFSKNIILFYFFLFIIIQIIGFYLNPKNYPDLYEYDFAFSIIKNNEFLTRTFLLYDQNYYLINLLSVVFFFFLLNSFNNQVYYKYLFIINILILILINIPIGVLAYKEFLLSSNLTAYWNKMTAPESMILSQSVPRVTGLSRSLIIIYIFLICYAFFKKNLSNKTLFLIFLLILGSLIWSLQSRAAVYSLFFFNLLIVSLSENKVKKKIFTILILCIGPIIIHNLISYASFKIKNQNTNQMEISVDRFKNQNRVTLVDTTGRIEIWKNIIEKSKTSLIFGKGSQADRWYLDRTDKWKNNASNALFYSLICGGFLGVIIYILIIYETIKLLLDCTLRLKFFRKENNNLYYSAFFILMFLLLRSIVENSFMIFSIDNLIFLSCFFLLKTSSKINQ